MSFKVGDVVTYKTKITASMVQQFADMSGDHNPVHMDDEYAKKTRFGKRIAHGMIAGALISRTLATDLGPGGIYLGQTMKFVNPIYIDDEVTIHLEVKSMRDKSGIALIETNVIKANGDVCVKGEATIMKASSL